MASASEAFEKLVMWKYLKTSLKVTLIVKGACTEVLFGIIFTVDDEMSHVGFSNPLVMHSSAGFDLEDAEFSIEELRLTATRNESDWIVFEEVEELPHAMK